MTNWKMANEISDRIVELLNERLVSMREAGQIEPMQLLGGQLLALKATFATMPPVPPDSVLGVLQASVSKCLALAMAVSLEGV